MASYFGEVVHPSSRAFWNDDDEDEIPDSTRDNIDYVLKWHEDEPLYFKKLIFVESEMMIDFVFDNLFDSTTRCICTVNCEFCKDCIKIYAVGDVYVCVVSTKLKLAHSGQLVSTMIPLLNISRQLILLMAEHRSHFISGEYNDSVSFLKTLCSHKARLDKNLNNSPLNQPNVITGVCSGVLSYAEIANLHCIMYVLYNDTFTLDSKNLLLLKNLFYETFGKSLLKLTTRDASCFNKGNLYM